MRLYFSTSRKLGLLMSLAFILTSYKQLKIKGGIFSLQPLKDVSGDKHILSRIREVNDDYTAHRTTEQSDIFISVKTTASYSYKLKVLFDTWIFLARNETYIVTDKSYRPPSYFSADHILVTNCSKGYTRNGLCCKMGEEYNKFMRTKKRWFCHVDDDTYVNIAGLVTLLQNYSHVDRWYIGRLTYNTPFGTLDKNGKTIEFRFAHGGAGFCISRPLAEDMIPFASGNRLAKMCDFIQQVDDPTIGYIINYLLRIPLSEVNLFHSHHEPLHTVSTEKLSEHITFSYKKNNQVNITGYNKERDPTRFLTIHCKLYPELTLCSDMP